MLESILPGDANQNVTIVTSWRKDHLRNRVSHVELFPLAEERGWTLYHNDKLHLKFYSNNLENALMGSANITSKALLDRSGDNIEGLVYLNNLNLEEQVFIQSIISSSKLVTTEVYEIYRDWYEENKQEMPENLPPIPTIVDDNKDDFLINKLPAIWSPTRLWELVSKVVEPESDWGEDDAMIHDLALYNIDINLEKVEFFKSLELAFFAQPFTKLFSENIDEEGYHFGGAKQWVQENCTTVPTPYRRELTETVQSLFNWFEELDPERYEVIQPNFSQIIRVKKGLEFNKYCSSTGRRLDRSWYVSEESFPSRGIQYKSCPWCSKLHGSELIFRIARVYPDSEQNRALSEFGFTPQRRSKKNPDGVQTWCRQCRRNPSPTQLPSGGLLISELESQIDGYANITSKAFE